MSLLLGILEQLVRHAVIDAAPHVEVLARAVRLSAGILLDPLDARLVRVDELGALGLARLLEVGAGIHRVFVVGPVEWTGAVVSGKVVSTEISHASDSEGPCEPAWP